MANDCWNYITIRSTNREEILKLVEYLDRYEKENTHENSDFTLTYKHKKELYLEFRMFSKWQPNYELLEDIVKQHKGCILKNIWNEEGGVNGIFLCEYDNEINELKTQKFNWMDMCIEEEYFYMSSKDL
jgi:hypothetical protein